MTEKLKQIPLTVPVPLTLEETLKIDTALATLNYVKSGKDPQVKALMEKLSKIRSESTWFKTVYPPEVEKILAKIDRERRRK